MSSSILYEVHTRRWLRSLSGKEGRVVTLDSIPESELSRWRNVGATHLWLMGVWSTGPKSREAYLNLPDTAERLRSSLPGWQLEDVSASPYAISSYTVPAEFGGESGLAAFRTQLRRHGIRLILDFVPNHLGLDHPWISNHPERFVQTTGPAESFFAVESRDTIRWLAHGKDPYFPPWIDTAQLDLRLEETQEAVIGDLQQIAARCDGVRCDMAMLALRPVFESTWGHRPFAGARAQAEFWPRAIAAAGRNNFLFIAEAYWDLESRMLELGFDYAYDKRITDHLVHRRWNDLENHLASRGDAPLRRSVHFLENHDEPRIAGQLAVGPHTLAAFLITALPGMSLIFDGQLEGARVQAPVQLGCNPAEPENAEVAALYRELIELWKAAGLAHAPGTVMKTSPLIIIHWEPAIARHVYAVINGRTSPQEITLASSALPPGVNPTIRSLRSDTSRSVATATCRDDQLRFLLPAESFDLLELTSCAP